jgi:hypothetical protein
MVTTTSLPPAVLHPKIGTLAHVTFMEMAAKPSPPESKEQEQEEKMDDMMEDTTTIPPRITMMETTTTEPNLESSEEVVMDIVMNEINLMTPKIQRNHFFSLPPPTPTKKKTCAANECDLCGKLFKFCVSCCCNVSFVIFSQKKETKEGSKYTKIRNIEKKPNPKTKKNHLKFRRKNEVPQKKK